MNLVWNHDYVMVDVCDLKPSMIRWPAGRVQRGHRPHAPAARGVPLVDVAMGRIHRPAVRIGSVDWSPTEDRASPVMDPA